MSDKINKIKQSVYGMEKQLRYLNGLVMELEKEIRKDYKEVPGVMGTFDGVNLIGEDGQKYEVPANYAAKSRLVCGDKLKLIEDEGKQLFKQITKVERNKLDAVVNKKEGKWYALAETGSYRLSDTAVTFNNLDINDKISILVPKENLNAGYAALDKVITQKAEKTGKSKEEVKKEVKQDVKPATPKVSKPAKREVRQETKSRKPSSGNKKESKEGREFVDQISGSGSIVLEEDDLR